MPRIEKPVEAARSRTKARTPSGRRESLTGRSTTCLLQIDNINLFATIIIVGFFRWTSFAKFSTR